MSSSDPSQKGRILCVGMCVLDVIHVCDQYPKEDSDRRCISGYWQRGGNASNNCTVLRNLGANCEFLGMLSDSAAFSFLLDDCRKRGIIIDRCPSTMQEPPFSSVILVQQTDSRTIIHSNSNFPILRYEHFRLVNLTDYSWIHFEARNPDETMKMLADISAHNEQTEETGERKVRISLEVEKMHVENLILVEMVDYVFLGKDMAKFLNFNDCTAAVHGLRDVLKLNTKSKRPAIICTWGAAGSCCLNENDKYHYVEPSAPTTIVDALGAGDTYCAATIYGLCELNLSLSDAMALGNRCAGFKLSRRGYDAIGEEFRHTDKSFM